MGGRLTVKVDEQGGWRWYIAPQGDEEEAITDGNRYGRPRLAKRAAMAWLLKERPEVVGLLKKRAGIK